MEQILIGRIDITDNLQFVIDTIQSQNPNVVVINLDEDNLQLKQCKSVLGGMELLPPAECNILEVNGDEQGYDYVYNMYYETDPNVNQYVTALITALYKGKNILLYYPTLDPSETKTAPKLVNLFWTRYGIGIGIVGLSDGVYDLGCIIIWLKIMYKAKVIGPMEFLAKYPSDAIIEEHIMIDLIEDIRPCCDSFDNAKLYILNIWKHIKENPNLKIPFYHI